MQVAALFAAGLAERIGELQVFDVRKRDEGVWPRGRASRVRRHGAEYVIHVIEGGDPTGTGRWA